VINAPSVRWARACDKPQMVRYHDREWGKPVPHDRKHFEMLLLEGAQAGLTWETILWKREGYRKAFDGFDPKTAAWFLFRRQHDWLCLCAGRRSGERSRTHLLSRRQSVQRKDVPLSILGVFKAT